MPCTGQLWRGPDHKVHHTHAPRWWSLARPPAACEWSRHPGRGLQVGRMGEGNRRGAGRARGHRWQAGSEHAGRTLFAPLTRQHQLGAGQGGGERNAPAASEREGERTTCGGRDRSASECLPASRLPPRRQPTAPQATHHRPRTCWHGRAGRRLGWRCWTACPGRRAGPQPSRGGSLIDVSRARPARVQCRAAAREGR